MTWAEFKHAMDAAGVKEGDELWYFDAAVSEDPETLNIFYDRQPSQSDPGKVIDYGWVVYG